MIFDLDVGIFLFEGFPNRLERLVDDQRRVPKQFAFFFRPFFEQGLAVGSLRKRDFLQAGGAARIGRADP